jgi:hypothetical protein
MQAEVEVEGEVEVEVEDGGVENLAVLSLVMSSLVNKRYRLRSRLRA